MTPELTEAIEELYRVFAHVPRPRKIDTSPYKNSEDYQRVLDTPLRQIPSDTIGPYAGSALLTVGDPEDYRYFLPRICECSIGDPGYPGFDPPIIAARLKRAGWAKWREPERRAISGFFAAAFTASLSEDYGNSPKEWLCGILSLGGEAERFLIAWRENTTIQAVLWLVDFAAIDEREIRPETLRERDEWEPVPFEQRRVVWDWLVSAASLEQIKSWLDRTKNQEHWEIEYGISVLEAKIHLG